ncbi:hypothetical protein HJFPF1_10262 [Paramyrothecium foliicola]|nr:hypothetical protein HJFPF1_10262 [Paramyrothecium foliicola]
MKFQLFATIIAGAFATSALAAPSTEPELATRANDKKDDVVSVDDKSLASIEFLFDEILAIPDDVLLKGDEATDKWLAENPLSDPDLVIETALSQRDVDVEDSDVLERGIGIPKAIKCAAAIADLIVGHVVPASKLLKIKKLIKSVGGVKKAVKLLLKAKTKAQFIKIGGSALWKLYQEISGIGSVRRNCFK